MNTRRFMTLAVTITVAVILAIGGMAFFQLGRITTPLYDSLPRTIMAVGSTSHLNSLAQLILYYDEVLTQSARNYALTQEQKWKIRYLTAEPELDQHIKHAIAEGSGEDRRLFQSIDLANQMLVDMEHRSIAEIDAERPAKARAILESAEYERQKDIYRQGLERYVAGKGAGLKEALTVSKKALDEAVKTGREAAMTGGLWLAFSIAIALAITGMMSLLASRFFRMEEKRKEAEEEVRLAAAVFESTTEGIMVTDTEGAIQYVNPAFAEITGFGAVDAVGQNPRILKAGLQDAEFYKELWSALSSKGKWRGEFWNKRKNGEIYPQETTINSIKNDQGRVIRYAAVFSDITERKKLEELLHRLSTIDGLTEIANRRALDDAIDREWRRALRAGSRLSFLMMDIDNFKNYNDIYGHQAGDRCIQSIAEVLKGVIRRPGDLAARYGGEEFSILLPTIDSDGAVLVAERIRNDIESLKIPHDKNNHWGVVTISLGVATLVPELGMEKAVLIDLADKALYRAKENGRNRVEVAAADAGSPNISDRQ